MITARRITLTDDRGQQVPLWSYRGNVNSDDPVLRSVAARAVQLEAVQWQRASMVWCLLVIPFAAVSTVSVPWAMPLALIIPLLGVLPLRRRIRGRLAPHLRLTLLAELCCPSCAYDLKGLAPELDGCTVCPECHGAWQLEDDMVRAREARERLAAPAPEREGETADDRLARDAGRRALAWLGWRQTYAARDERGRMVELVRPGLFAARPPFWLEIPEHRRRAVRLSLYCVGWPRRLLLLVVAPLMAASGWGMLLTGAPGPTTTPSVALAIIQGILLPLIFVGMALNPMSRSGKPIIRIMLREGHCPSCAAKLPPPSTPDGETICPACRAAWKRVGV